MFVCVMNCSYERCTCELFKEEDKKECSLDCFFATLVKDPINLNLKRYGLKRSVFSLTVEDTFRQNHKCFFTKIISNIFLYFILIFFWQCSLCQVGCNKTFVTWNILQPSSIDSIFVPASFSILTDGHK